MNWYVLINGVGFIAAIFLLEHRLRVLPPRYSGRAYVLAVCSVPVGWLAAHLGDCVIRGLSFSQAGFAFYWGLFGAAFFYLSIGAVTLGSSMLLRTINLLIPVVVLSHAFGRIGCFFTGCCYGCSIPHTHMRIPTQLIEAGFLTILGLFMLRRSSDPHPPNLTVYLIVYPAFRFLIEFLRADDRGVIFGLSTSQFLSLPLASLGVLALWHWWRNKNKDKSEQGAAGQPAISTSIS